MTVKELKELLNRLDTNYDDLEIFIHKDFGSFSIKAHEVLVDAREVYKYESK